VTYHGPGQLIGYPIFDLRSLHNAKGARLGPVDFVRLMEEALIRLCGEFRVPAGRIAGLTGVWVRLAPTAAEESPNVFRTQPSSKGLPPAGPEAKIAAIGIHVARGVTSHGFAFNVTTRLDDFRLIHPCGITDKPVTSLAREIADPAALPPLESLADRAAQHFGTVFGQPVEKLDSLAALRARVRAVPADGPEPSTSGPRAQEFPAEDAPLQIPAEIERLRGTGKRPIAV
jgi:lipoyl(octanoyl) transferase